jgi:hypothetical protein
MDLLALPSINIVHRIISTKAAPIHGIVTVDPTTSLLEVKLISADLQATLILDHQ